MAFQAFQSKFLVFSNFMLIKNADDFGHQHFFLFHMFFLKYF